MAAHERLCFAEASRLELDQVDVHPMVDGVPGRARLKTYDAVFFGGSGAFSVLDDVQWIQDSVNVMLDVLALQVPTWASCFGFQGLARALGGEVVADPEKTEMGSTQLRLTEAGRSDPLMRVLPTTFWAQEGHHDRVVRLPRGVDLLAEGDFVREQAFRVTGAPFWASQFHPELTVERTVDRFRHYRDLYLHEEDDPDATLELLASGEETDEMRELLPRLVRHQF